jgi:hypothetical protein
MDLKLAPFPTRSPLPSWLYLLSRCSHQLDSWMIQRSEISRQLVAILLFGGNVTILLPFGLLPFGASYPQDEVALSANMPKNVKEKMHSQRPCLLSRIFTHETYE